MQFNPGCIFRTKVIIPSIWRQRGARAIYFGPGADVAEGNTCQTQFWLKLTLLSFQDVQPLLRELEHNCTSRARCSPLECILADCGSREVASIQSPGCAPCPHRLRLLVFVLWGCFLYFGIVFVLWGVILVLIAPHAFDYALCTDILTFLSWISNQPTD